MKWARIKKAGKPSADKNVDINDSLCYKDFQSEEHFNKTFNHKSREWVTHEFEYNFGKSDNFKKFQKRYEIFCGGYLHYYDMITRNGLTDHCIAFRWNVTGKNKYAVTILLSPPPLKQKKENLALTTSKLAAGKKFMSNGTMVLAAESSPGGRQDDYAIDPPPPPPPPPPPLHE